MYDSLIIGVSDNPKKDPMFTVEDRISFLSEALDDLPNVEIDSFQGLLVEFCRKSNAQTIIKGLRAVSDFEYEFMMAQMNRTLDSNVETVFMMASPEFAYLSSSVVKEIAGHGGDTSMLVPETVNGRLGSWKPR